MIRWNSSDAYGLFAGLIEQSPIETRDQAAHTLYQARVATTIAKARRREKQSAKFFQSLCWGLVTLVAVGSLLLVSSCVDDPRDHVGPDELNHVRAGRQVVEVTQ